jgi:hypothetical protein
MIHPDASRKLMHLLHSSTLGPGRPSTSDPPKCDFRTRPSWAVNTQVVRASEYVRSTKVRFPDTSDFWRLHSLQVGRVRISHLADSTCAEVRWWGLNSGGDASGLEMHQACSLSRMVLTCIVSGVTLTRGGRRKGGGGATRSGRVCVVYAC